MPPEEENQGMTQITISLPTPLLNEAKELAEFEGYRVTEFHRTLWEKGFAVHAEGSNKRLVNRGLREKYNSQVKDC